MEQENAVHLIMKYSTELVIWCILMATLVSSACGQDLISPDVLCLTYYSCTQNDTSSFYTLRPYDDTNVTIEDNYDQLININNFSFLINPQPCKNYSAGLLLMVIVSSSPSNQEKRNAIRNTWGQNTESTKVVFLVGISSDEDVSNKVLNESIEYGDMVQGNFNDSYRNLTYKHVMGLKWVTHNCNTAKYVLKTDDDVLVNIYELREILADELSPWGATNLIMCSVIKHGRVHRYKASKWMVTQEEYSPQYYPTFCPGWAILYSQDMIRRLLVASQSTPFFWIDDVYITGICAEKIGVTLTNITSTILTRDNLKIWKTQGQKYNETFMFSYNLDTELMKDTWKIIDVNFRYGRQNVTYTSSEIK